MCGKPARASEDTKNNNNNKTKRVMHDTKTPCHAAKNINEAKKKKKKKGCRVLTALFDLMALCFHSG